tara:strand:- start:616 stop:780 length:165 start_codon:yes stop_codon:yes gene_type:complete
MSIPHFTERREIEIGEGKRRENVESKGEREREWREKKRERRRSEERLGMEKEGM